MTGKKINSIVLIDDSEADNFLHKKVIRNSNITEDITVFKNAREALDWLSTPDEIGVYPGPDIVFLDINMPGMNGWEFLDAYSNLSGKQLANILIVMLTNSTNPADRKKAEKIEMVGGFVNKPLTVEMLNGIAA